jgi:hypothetical protein
LAEVADVNLHMQEGDEHFFDDCRALGIFMKQFQQARFVSSEQRIEAIDVWVTVKQIHHVRLSEKNYVAKKLVSCYCCPIVFTPLACTFM